MLHDLSLEAPLDPVLEDTRVSPRLPARDEGAEHRGSADQRHDQPATEACSVRRRDWVVADVEVGVV